MNAELGQRLRETRKAQGLTQAQLACKAQVGQQTVSDIETGKSRSARDLAKLAQALGVTTDYLIGAESAAFANELYDLAMKLPPDRREDALLILRTLTKQ